MVRPSTATHPPTNIVWSATSKISESSFQEPGTRFARQIPVIIKFGKDGQLHSNAQEQTKSDRYLNLMRCWLPTIGYCRSARLIRTPQQTPKITGGGRCVFRKKRTEPDIVDFLLLLAHLDPSPFRLGLEQQCYRRFLGSIHYCY